MKIGIGSDINGYELKDMLKNYIETQGFDVVDYGVKADGKTDYPKIAESVANDIINDKLDRGILICGTGIGMAISANKVKGIRAAQTHDVYSAERAQLSNNAQIITIGSLIVGPELAKKIVDTYLNNTFTLDDRGKSSAKKIEQIIAMESGE
ncbi:RpiB/LacA/LacB family sugar-phosphate isomerase [Vagococcus carniphilus]|uniref:RpiB/LacA/LacB family sugar-phosphate isomerase n=1 Tax=Vagococcus carniphilus TaxID=218144 RepID=A0A430AN72_9ENTE|nr:RpiB/LacA/LacB family sugar-phosphate isomerase [Vagococcus carniphilus]QNN72660.1 RpiB/LacA/LacB family sugar-phosphate isomerase [Vagococcus carniphilus]RSU09423.1 RpiB/LacA/LacB family sugar-phosphate isomerase [Vagococcus carniphilus]